MIRNGMKIPILQTSTQAGEDFNPGSQRTDGLHIRSGAVLWSRRTRTAGSAPSRSAPPRPRPCSRESWETDNGADVSVSSRPPREPPQPQPGPPELREQKAWPGQGW